MFCYQCQETAKNEGCVKVGVCGKTDEVASLQDLLIWLLKGVSYYGTRARALEIRDPEADLLVTEGLFATITNVNFDAGRFVDLVRRVARLRDRLGERFRAAFMEQEGHAFAEPLPEFVTWAPGEAGAAELAQKGAAVGVMADGELNPDLRSLRELLTYGLKGMAAYADHARVLGHEDGEVDAFLQQGLLATTDESLGGDELTVLVLRCGEMGVKVMALLDRANTATYGVPEPTRVDLGVTEGPAILISGHDLRDLDELLQQTEGTGVNVYTHGEMLPAHGYPGLKKYRHLVGNYGGAWHAQAKEFEAFGGAILMTTNCLVQPRDSYKDRLFTTGLVGWEGVQHISDREQGGQKDFGPLIARAKQLGSPKELERGSVTVGFAHGAVLGLADKVVEAVKSGAIKRFVVMAGCDGRHKTRGYFTEIARGLPADNVILTAGCAKYRYNKLDLGDIGGIPRVLDAGQCNDSYSLVVVALKLAEAFGVDHVNDLPISYDIAWYEQKAVIVLLALLHLGVKDIRLGPTLPAFVSPGVLDVLVQNFNIKPTGSVQDDLDAMAAGR